MSRAIISDGGLVKPLNKLANGIWKGKRSSAADGRRVNFLSSSSEPVDVGVCYKNKGVWSRYKKKTK